MPVPFMGLRARVPVSTADSRVQKPETATDQALVHELLNRGWRVGCDAELLPPRSWYEGDA